MTALPIHPNFRRKEIFLCGGTAGLAANEIDEHEFVLFYQIKEFIMVRQYKLRGGQHVKESNGFPEKHNGTYL